MFIIRSGTMVLSKKAFGRRARFIEDADLWKANLWTTDQEAQEYLDDKINWCREYLNELRIDAEQEDHDLINEISSELETYQHARVLEVRLQEVDA